MSTDPSDEPGTSTRVRSGGGVRRERQEERGEEENLEDIPEGADSLREQGSGSQDQASPRELLLLRQLNIQRESNVHRELTIQRDIVRMCAVILTLLFSIFAVRTVDVAMDYQSALKQLQPDIDNLTLENQQWQARFHNLTLQCPSHDDLTLKIKELENELNHFKSETVNSCPSGWMQFGRSCYYRSTEKKTWEESREQCLKTGAHLVIINSKEEQEFIGGLTRLRDEESWIGLKRTGAKWTWVETPLTTKYWASGMPGNWQYWDCAEYQHNDRKWVNKPCSDIKDNKNYWICEK